MAEKDKDKNADDLRLRTRADYPYTLSYRTRWSDNDQYAHMNNAIYYHLFDSIVNTYLIERCGLTPPNSPQLGLVVASHCQFFSPLSFPQILDLCLRVSNLGTRSVSYEIGVFKKGEERPAAVGGYTHVFVEREGRRSVSMEGRVREGLRRLSVKAGEKGWSGRSKL